MINRYRTKCEAITVNMSFYLTSQVFFHASFSFLSELGCSQLRSAVGIAPWSDVFAPIKKNIFKLQPLS